MENNQSNNFRTQNLNFHTETDIDMESFIEKLKSQDTLYKKLSLFFMWVYIAFIIIYILKTILFSYQEINRLISDICFIVAAIFFVFIFIYYLKIYNRIDYSAPLYQMLKKVVERYRFSIPVVLVTCIPVIIMDIGISFNVANEPFGSSVLNRVLFIQAFYLPMMILAGYIGVRIWKKNQKPLRDKALMMLKELEE